MFSLARRLAGGLLLFGIVYFFFHGLYDSRSVVVSGSLWGALPFTIWTLMVLVGGVLLVLDLPCPWQVHALGLIGWLVGCMILFGTVPPFLNQIHDERGIWLGYFFNIIPIVQGMSWAVLGQHHDAEPVGLVPAE